MIFINSYFEDERPAWGEHEFCKDVWLTEKQSLKLRFEPIIARGSIAFNSCVERELLIKGFPNILYPFNSKRENYLYSKMLRFNKMFDLLNSDGNKGSGKEILELFKSHKELWIRSDSGQKVFSGGLFDKKRFSQELDYLNSKGIIVDFVYAKPKLIYEEYRFIIVNGKVVDGSLYMKKNEPEFNKKPNNLLFEFAQKTIEKAINNGLAEKTIVMDLTSLGQIIEFNSIMTSGWYSCDLEKVVGEIKKDLNKYL